MFGSVSQDRRIMAHSSAKKLAKSNASLLRALLKAIIGTNAFFLLMCRVVNWQTFGVAQISAWAACGAVQLACYLSLFASGRPTYHNGTVVDGGTDIGAAGGVMEYVRDVLYVSLLVQVLCVISSYALLVFLVVPAYAIYLMISARSSVPDFGAMAQQEQTAPLSRKERRKQERESRKM